MVSVSPLTSCLILAAGNIRRLLAIVILHDNEPRRSYQQTQDMLAKLLSLLEAGEADKFAAHVTNRKRLRFSQSTLEMSKNLQATPSALE